MQAQELEYRSHRMQLLFHLLLRLNAMGGAAYGA
jgi:hypothetical protein